MIFQRIQRSDADKIFTVVRNDYATASLTNGQGVMWNFPATTPDGVGVTRPTARATSAGVAMAGVVAQTIAYLGYGLVQLWGYHAAVRARTVTGGTPAISKGRPLAHPVAGGVFCLESIATGSAVILRYPMGFSLGATAGFTTSAIAAFIKAL